MPENGAYQRKKQVGRKYLIERPKLMAIGGKIVIFLNRHNDEILCLFSQNTIFQLISLFQILIILFMLYLLRCLRTSLSFEPRQLDKLASVSFIWQQLKNKYEGSCTYDHGLIVLINDPALDSDNASTYLSKPKVNSRGLCVVQVQFSAISFKVQRKDLIWARVSEINEDCITCKLKYCTIKIPRSKIDQQLVYDKSLSMYRMSKKNMKIQIGDHIISQCFDVRVEMNCSFMIIGELPLHLLNLSMLRK